MATAPHYKKLHQTLKAQILGGTYEKGNLLPSENQLSKKYKINRMTVRHALGELVKEGLIAKKAGKGSIVVTTRKSLGLLSLKGFSEVVGSLELPAQTIELKKPHFTSWDSPFFYPLSKEELKNGCIKMIRLRSADNAPIILENTYVQNKNLKDICKSPLLDNSLFHTLQVNYKIEITNVEQDMRAIKAPSEIAHLLSVRKDTPLIHIYRKYSTCVTDLFIYSSLYCNTENYTIGNKF